MLTRPGWPPASAEVDFVADLRQVPPVGATVLVGAAKVTGATGGPMGLNRRLVGGDMVVHHMLAMGAGILLSSPNLRTANPPALTGIWESEGCGDPGASRNADEPRSRFLYLEDESALEPVRLFRRGVHDAITPCLLPRPVWGHTTVDHRAGRLRRRLRIHAQAPRALHRGAARRSESCRMQGAHIGRFRGREEGRVSNRMLVGRARFSMHPGVRFGESRRRAPVSGGASAGGPRSVSRRPPGPRAEVTSAHSRLGGADAGQASLTSEPMSGAQAGPV